MREHKINATIDVDIGGTFTIASCASPTGVHGATKTPTTGYRLAVGSCAL